MGKSAIWASWALSDSSDGLFRWVNSIKRSAQRPPANANFQLKMDDLRFRDFADNPICNAPFSRSCAQAGGSIGSALEYLLCASKVAKRLSVSAKSATYFLNSVSSLRKAAKSAAGVSPAKNDFNFSSYKCIGKPDIDSPDLLGVFISWSLKD